MSDLNRAMIIGRLGRDPEVRYTPDGRAVASFSLATTDKWRDKQTGEMRERTEWHRIVAFGRLGEICGEYLSKGKQIFIEGRLRTRSWEKDGVTRYTTEIEATNMQMLGARGDAVDNGRAGSYSDGGRAGNHSDSGRAGSYSDGGRAGNYSDGGRAGNYPDSSRPGNFSSDSGPGSNYSNEGGYQSNNSDGGYSDNFSNRARQNDNVPDQGYPEPSYNEPPDDDIPF